MGGNSSSDSNRQFPSQSQTASGIEGLEKIRTTLTSSGINIYQDKDEDNLSVHSTHNVCNEKDEDDDRANLMFAADGDLDFPEGGKQAYLVLFGSFTALTFAFGVFNSLGVIETYLSENQLKDVKSSTVSWIFSIMLFVNFLTLVFSGVYFDRNGSRLLVLLGWILTVASMLGTANSTKVWHFILSFSILSGVGGGMIISPAFGCVAQYFSKKRGLMTSIASTGGSIGGIIFPLMLRKLFEDIGFAWAMRVCALFATVCYSFAFLFLKERLPKQRRDDLTRLQKLFTYTNALDLKAFKEWKFVFVVVGCTLGECAAFVTQTYLASYARSQGESLSTSYLLLSVSQACAIPGRWITGYLSDKYGRFNIMTLTLSICGLLPYIILLPFKGNLAALFAFTSIWGFFSGSLFSLLPVCCAQISKTEEFGRRYGTMYSVVSFGTLASIPIGGAIIGDGDPSQYLKCLVYYAGSLMFASCAGYMISKFFCVGPRVFVKF